MGLYGALESNGQSATWQVKNPAAVVKEIAALAKAIGLVDAVSPVPTERLLETDWRPAAERIERLLFENSKVALGEQTDELVIVPDGLLWYLPFELLPVGSARNVAADDPTADPAAPAAPLLRDVCRIRYAPTRSLAVLRFEPGRGGGPLGIHAGKMFRGDKPEIAQDVLERFGAAFDRVVKLPLPAVGGPAAQPGGGTTVLAGSLCDTLVILDELSGDGPIAARPLATGTPAKGGLTFGDWLAPPRKRPRLVVLAGLQTALAGGLAKLPAQPGDDLFLAATDLLAAGARTAVVSRWRTGGKSSVDLVEEFIRDVADAEQENAADADGRPLPAAAESWRRAVDLITAEQPDLSREPRVKQSSGAVLTDARHPFFWAGYAVVDCGAGRYADPAPVPPAGGKNAVAIPQPPPPQAAPQPPLPQAAP
jgi:hypothetical protein